jgi:uncharacterized damage-inducible protein DinB
VASLAFHVYHLAGSTRRLLLTALGEGIGPPEREARARESAGEFSHDARELLDALQGSVDEVLLHLRSIDTASLSEPRAVGRMHLPSSVGGVLFHIAEHAARHAGQVVTTARLIRAEGAS